MLYAYIYEILIRTYDIISRYNKIIDRNYEIQIVFYQKISRNNEILRNNNFTSRNVLNRVVYVNDVISRYNERLIIYEIHVLNRTYRILSLTMYIYDILTRYYEKSFRKLRENKSYKRYTK